MRLARKFVEDHIGMRSMLRGVTLGAASAGNPYPNGISVAGTGSSVPWSVAWYVPDSVWVANSGFGIAPIYTNAQFDMLYDPTTSMQSPLGIQDIRGPLILGLKSESFLGTETDTGTVYVPGDSVVISTADGGSQRIDYRFDGRYWIPSAAQGIAKPSISIWDKLIEAGAIIGATIATAGATGILGPTTAGPGAVAVGGSETVAAGASIAAPALVAAPVAQLATPVLETTAPEITGFTVPEVAAPAVVDVSSTVPIDIQAASNAAAVAASSPLSQVFSMSKYIQTLAGAYTTGQKLLGGTHPQAGSRTTLPDGSIVIVNRDGSSTVTQPDGTATTIGAGGTITPGAPHDGTSFLVLAVLGAAYFLSPV